MIRTLLYITGCFLLTRAAYLNDYDAPLYFTCPKHTQSISYVHSIHSNHDEDRIFEISCREILDDPSGLNPACYWTDWLNNYDEMVHYSCPLNDYVSGIQSIHNNHDEDRIWKIYCCRMPEVHMVDCSFTGWTNSYDGVQAYTLPEHTVMKGMVSVHNNHDEDRVFEYMICGIERRSNGEVIVG